MASPTETDNQSPANPTRLAELRKELFKGEHLTLKQRRLVLEQAQALIDNVYVHRPHKSAMYGINPGQQLRQLGRQLPDLTDAAFHYALLRIFDGLRDSHTMYVLPTPFHKRVTLGITLERYWEPATPDPASRREPRYIVSKTPREEAVAAESIPDAKILYGAEVRYWNGMPIQVAVERNAEMEAGGNAAARLAQGLETMTVRSLAFSPIPAEDWVDLGYCVDDTEGTVRLPWRVTDEPPELRVDLEATQERRRGVRLALGQRTEFTRRSKVDIFATPPKKRATVDGIITMSVVESDRKGTPDGKILKDELHAFALETPSRKYGYLRIFTFWTATYSEKDGAKVFLEEIRDLLKKLPPCGLILDVRGNPGGYVDAAEAVLGYLTSRPVELEPMQLISSDTTYQLSERSPGLARWRLSLGEAGGTGAQYSAALPPEKTVDPDAGIRTEPIVLITDALSYSATDMFAATFQDNHIGTVLGVDDNTGAGGATMWSQAALVRALPGGPFQPLPGGAYLEVAAQRFLRTGRQAGRPVEDLGVTPDVRYRMTRDDLLEKNRDLVKRAVDVLDDFYRGKSPAADCRQGQ